VGATGPTGATGTIAVAGAITGTAVCNGSPVPAGTLVYVPGSAFLAYTGSDGSFRFNNVPAGSYNVSVVEGGQTVATVNGVAVASVSVSMGSVTACATSNSGGGECSVTCGPRFPLCYCDPSYCAEFPEECTRGCTCIECMVNQECVSWCRNFCSQGECFDVTGALRRKSDADAAGAATRLTTASSEETTGAFWRNASPPYYLNTIEYLPGLVLSDDYCPLSPAVCLARGAEYKYFLSGAYPSGRSWTVCSTEPYIACTTDAFCAGLPGLESALSYCVNGECKATR
jgi:hypothetical protein